MNAPFPCEQTCTLSCSAPCGLHAPGERFSLTGVLDRFAREATQGVCDTGHYRCRYFTWGEGPPLLFVPGLMHRLHPASFAALPPEQWDHFIGSTGTLPARALGHRARLLHRVDLRDQLAEVRQPVLLVCGDQDPLVRPQDAEALLRALPSAG